MRIPLTMDDFANIYDKHHGGRKARTLQMETVFAWVEKSPYVEYNEQRDEFYKKENI